MSRFEAALTYHQHLLNVGTHLISKSAIVAAIGVDVAIFNSDIASYFWEVGGIGAVVGGVCMAAAFRDHMPKGPDDPEYDEYVNEENGQVLSIGIYTTLENPDIAA